MSLQALPHDERAIVDAILDAALSRGFLVSVYDGEAYAVGFSSDYSRVREHVGETDETTLRFRDPSATGADVQARLVGWVFLVHGNGSDVIADYSDTSEMERLLSPARALADQFSGAL